MPNLSASDLAGRRIRQVRQRRKWTAKDLAALCADAGAPYITASVITDLETRRRSSRKITLDELLVLAHVLEVPPLLLFVPLDDAEVLEVVPGVELGALDAAAWIADDDAMLGPGRELLSTAARDTERVTRRRQGTTPLTIVRQLRVLARAIKQRDRLLSSETYRQRFPGSEIYDRNAIVLYGIRLLELADWLASLGYAPPEMAEVQAIVRRTDPGTPAKQEEDMRGLETEPPEIARAQQLLWHALPGIDASTPGTWPCDAAIDAEDEDDEDSEVTGYGPVP